MSETNQNLKENTNYAKKALEDLDKQYERNESPYFPLKLLFTATILVVIMVIVGLSLGPAYKPIFDILISLSSVIVLVCLIYFIWSVEWR